MIKSIILLAIILGTEFWWQTGYRTYIDNNLDYPRVCTDHPYGMAWRVGHTPELLIEGNCK